MQSKSSYQYIVDKVVNTRKKETLLMLLSGLSMSLGITFLAVILAALLENILNGDVGFRTFLAVALGIILLTSLGIFFVPQLLRMLGIKWLPSINEIAIRVGNYYTDIKDKLGNIIQLVSHSEKNIGSSQSLIDAEVEEIYQQTQTLDFDVIIDKKRNYLMILFFATALLLLIGTMSFSSNMNDALNRIMNYSQSFIPPAPFTINLDTPTQTLLRGSKCEIIFSATGDKPDYISIHIKEENQQGYDEYKLKRNDEGKYIFEIATVRQNMEFYGEAKWITSSIVTNIGIVKMIDRPMIRTLSGVLTYPSYTKLAYKSIDEQTADIIALSGSNAQFTITANKKIKNAFIVFEKTILDNGGVENIDAINSSVDTIHIPMKVADNKAMGGFRIYQNGFYYFVIEDFDGEQNINPIKYSVVALKDDTPSISFLYPTTDVQVTSQAILPIKVAITDDYGFSNLKLHYRLISSKFSSPEEKFSSITIPINSTDLAVEIGYVWDLNKIGIVPEDEYEFYLEIADNDFSNGPKTAKTQTLAVRLPSMAEVAKEADLAQNQISKELDDVKKQAENVKKDIEELERDLLKKDRAKELDWKQQKKLQDIIQKQNQLEQQLNQLSKQVDQTAEQLQQNNMLSEETMQKYQELQQLMKEVKSPELDRMRGMQEKQLQQMTPEELRKAMEQAKFDEERFKKSIERTMEILKRMQAEQKTDAVTKRAEALQKKQDELNKELNNANSNDKNKMNELAKKQDQLKSEMDNLAKDMNDLEDLMKEIGDDMPMQEMKEAMDEMKNDNISQDMENSSNSMEQGDKNNADKSQKSASKKLSQLSKKMQKTKQEMQNKNSKEMVRKMQKSIENMASISKKQEKVKNFTKRSDINSTKVPEISEEQADIFEDLYNVANDINDMGGKSFAITAEMAENVNNALRNMRNTMDQLTDRRMNQAAQMQTSAMKSINAAMMEMQDALAQMQSQGDCDNGSGMGQKNKPGGKGGMGMGMGMGSPGFQQKMQQLAAEQQALNQQMQQLGQGGEGSNGQMSQEQRAAMKRLSGEQDRVRKSMEELAKEQKENGGKPNDKNDGNKLQNELNKMAEEMKEITSEINKGNISPETLQRQEKILSRLLDVTRSVNDRDFENKREANSGKDILQRSPSGIDLSTQEGKTRAMQELMQSIKRGYTKDYEQVIRQYFDAIQKHY